MGHQTEGRREDQLLMCSCIYLREPVNNVADIKCFRFYVHILIFFLVFTLHPSQINCAVKPSFTHAQLHSWAFLMEFCLHADTSRLTQVSHENSALALITN